MQQGSDGSVGLASLRFIVHCITGPKTVMRSFVVALF